MILGIDRPIELWEAVSAIQLVQAIQKTGECSVAVVDGPGVGIFALVEDGIDIYSHPQKDEKVLNFDVAYRKADQTDQPYCYTLAKENGFELELDCPQFPKIQPTQDAGIIVCPFGLKNELDLPLEIWKHIIKQLRTYGESVMLLGDPGQRMDSASFTEGENLSEWALLAKIQALASAKLVVGVPNAWTWIATAWEKDLVYFYPDSIPPRRWFPFISNHFGRIGYESRDLKAPTVLAGLRKMISVL